MRKLCAGLLIGGASIVAAPGFIFIEANLFNSTDYFGGSGNQAYGWINLSIDDAEIVSAEISSPSGGITGGTEGSASNTYSSFEDLRSEIQSGPWTLTVGRNTGEGEPVMTTYQFNVNIAGLTAPESFSILSPANGSIDVPHGPTLFQWSPPSDVYSTQGVDLNDVTGSMGRSSYATIGIGPGHDGYLHGLPGLDEGRRYHFFVQYSQDVTGFPDVSISTPVDAFSNELDFGYSIGLHNEATTVFTTVPEPAAWMALTGVGMAALMGIRLRRGSRRAS